MTALRPPPEHEGERRCGTCAHHKYVDARNDADGWRYCRPPMPFWAVGVHATSVEMGTDCPVWVSRELGRPNGIVPDAEKIADHIVREVAGLNERLERLMGPGLLVSVKELHDIVTEALTKVPAE